MKPHYIIVVFAFLLASCSKFDKAEQRPAFLKIDNIELQTNPSTQGTNSNKIVDAWVYVDNILVGTFDLPAVVPITKVGEREIKIYAGIKKNGISVDRKRYPFYKPYTYTANLQVDSVYTVNPTITYEDNLYFWIEDFEDPSFKLSPYQSDTVLKRVVQPASQLFEGGAGLIALNTNTILCEMRTDEASFNTMPTNLTSEAYLELNYRSNYPMEVGVLANRVAGEPYERSPLITLYSTNNQWNKTYLYLPDASNFFQGAPEMDIYFRVFNPNGVNGIEVYLDNIKVIYYN